MLMMRLQRVGRRNEAHFKIVVIEKSKGPKSQKYVDIVGSYNPKLGRVQLDENKVRQWLDNGVQPSDTVANMLIDQNLLEGRKRNVLPKKSPTKKRNAPEVEEPKEAPQEEVSEAPAEEVKEEVAAEPETPAEEEVIEETVEEAQAETTEETPEAPVEEASEEQTEETPEESIEESSEEEKTEE